MFGTITNCGSALICTPCECVYVYTTTQAIIWDLSCLDTTNCCDYPIIQTVNSNKPSQPLHPPFCPHKLTPKNHHNHYIHRSTLTQLTPRNHHSHHIHRSALTQLTPTNHHNHYIHRFALTQLTPANHHSHYIHHPALTNLPQQTITANTSTVQHSHS